MNNEEKIKTIGVHLEQVNKFYKELKNKDWDFIGDIEELDSLCEETDMLRAGFSVLYAKLIDGENNG